MHNKHATLKIFAGSTDKIGPKLFYEYIVQKARDLGLSGATVYRGIMGYGSSSSIHTSKFWELTEKLPVVVELIDDEKKIESFYQKIEPFLNEMPKGCLVVKENTEIKLCKAGVGNI